MYRRQSLIPRPSPCCPQGARDARTIPEEGMVPEERGHMINALDGLCAWAYESRRAAESPRLFLFEEERTEDGARKHVLEVMPRLSGGLRLFVVSGWPLPVGRMRCFLGALLGRLLGGLGCHLFGRERPIKQRWGLVERIMRRRPQPNFELRHTHFCFYYLRIARLCTNGEEGRLGNGLNDRLPEWFMSLEKFPEVGAELALLELSVAVGVPDIDHVSRPDVASLHSFEKL